MQLDSLGECNVSNLQCLANWLKKDYALCSWVHAANSITSYYRMTIFIFCILSCSILRLTLQFSVVNRALA